MSCNTPFWPLLSLTGGWIGLVWSIGWSCQALAPVCFIPTVLLNLHLQQIPNPYLLGVRRRWLRVNCIERIGIWPVLRTWNWQWLRNLPSAWVYWLRTPISNKANGLPLSSFPTQEAARKHIRNKKLSYTVLHLPDFTWPSRFLQPKQNFLNNGSRVISLFIHLKMALVEPKLLVKNKEPF